MKTRLNPTLKLAASAMLVALCLMTILALSIAGYLTYVQQQSSLGARAQTWNMAMSIAEAGIEEALQHLNSNTSNLGVDGWTGNGSSYTVTRALADGNSYTVTIDATTPNSPVIVSRGNVTPPALVYNAPPVFYAAVGVNNTVPNVARAVRVTTARGSLFLAAMVARHQIDMNGNNVATDSFDSADPAKSTNGLYDPSKVGTYDSNHGDVASNDGVVNSVSAGNANIYGHVSTGPGGTATVGSQGAIGDHAWQATHTGIEPNWVLDNANFTFPTTDLPYNSGTEPPPGDVVVISGRDTNTIVVTASPTPPGTPGIDQTIGPVTTNVISSVSSIYPGSAPGLSTNTTWNTSATYPGNVPALSTNYTSFTTTTTYPGPQPALVTNILVTTTTVSSYPGPMYGGVITNCSNILTSQKGQPAAGTYCGVPVQTGQGNENNSGWSYYAISGYSYHNLSYTYANQISYTYPTYTYGYVTYTYSYIIYQGIPIYTTNHYDHVIQNGDYYATSLSGTTYVVGSARLVLPNGLNMSGHDQITVGQGGSIKVYSGGTDLTVGGNGVMNNTGFAGNFIVYGTPTVTSVDLNGNGAFIGVLVAPNARVRMNGSGTSIVQDFTGSLMVNSVTMNGHFNFHYDEALSRMGGTGRFLVTSWNEVPAH